MSRPNKILKLVIGNEENIRDYFAGQDSSISNNILIENTDNQGLGVEKPESPLPPGAENIVNQFREVAQEVFADGDEDRNLVEDLTLFGIEDANTSFEISPSVVIEELENIVASTPKSPLPIPTSMLSPINSHKTCNDLLCALHDHWTDAIPSSPSTVSGLSSFSESDTNSVPSPRTKKTYKK